MELFRHEKLDVWRKSMDFAVSAIDLTNVFPDREKYSLTDQIRRAAVALPSNIAEGAGRNSDREFARFLGIAYGSLMEVLTQLEIALRLRYMDEKVYKDVRLTASEIAKCCQV